MRTKNSIINIIASLLTYVLITLNSLITPKILEQLGKFTPGLNSLFMNTISLMNIVELGIGVAIVYKLYEPIEKKDYKKVAVILNFYKKAYVFIATAIVVVGLIASFIVPNFLDKDASQSYDRTWVSFAFLFYVLDVLSSYLFAHRRAMITADQKNYINNISHGVGVTASCVLQILVLNLFHSFFMYAIVKVICTLLENFFIFFWYKSKYSFIDLKIKDELSSREKNDLFKNLKALLLHKIASAALRSSPSLVMSRLNTVVNGHYSVYMLVTNGFISVTEQVFGGVTASFGNLIITSPKKVVFSKFKIIYFANYFLYSILCTGFFNCLNPFIKFFYGPEWIMSMVSVSIMLLYLFVMGMRQSLLLVKISAGIYRADRYFALLEAILNILLTIILGKIFGINGILSANVISMLLVPVWTQPYLVYKNVFEEKLSHYYKKLALYFLLTVFSISLTAFVCNSIAVESSFLSLIIRMLVSLLIPISMNVLLFYKTEEMRYMKKLLSGIGRKFFRRDSN